MAANGFQKSSITCISYRRMLQYFKGKFSGVKILGASTADYRHRSCFLGGEYWLWWLDSRWGRNKLNWRKLHNSEKLKRGAAKKNTIWWARHYARVCKISSYSRSREGGKSTEKGGGLNLCLNWRKRAFFGKYYSPPSHYRIFVQ